MAVKKRIKESQVIQGGPGRMNGREVADDLRPAGGHLGRLSSCCGSTVSIFAWLFADGELHPGACGGPQ